MKRKWPRRITFALLGLAILFAVAYLWADSFGRSRLEAEQKAIREAGEPLLLEEMAPPPVPDAENAAIPLEQAFALLEEEAETEVVAVDLLLENPFGAPSDAARTAEAWVARNADALERVERAAQLPACRFDIDWSRGFEVESPQVWPLLTIQRLLATRTILAARANRFPDAWGDCRRALALAKFIGSDPLLILFFVRVAMENIVLGILPALSAKSPPEPDELDALLAALSDADLGEGLRRSILGERCFGSSIFAAVMDDRSVLNLMAPLDATGSSGSPLLLRLLPAPAFRLDHARYLALMRRTLDLADRPWREARKDWKTLTRDSMDSPWYAFLTRLVITVLADSAERTEIHRARLALARGGLMLDSVRARTGELPASFPGPEILDPFTGKPLAYQVTEGGYALYSVGPNLKDDGGEAANPADPSKGDLIWR